MFDAPAVSDPTTDPAGRWTALLLVDEGPRRALESLVAAAGEAGFTVSDPSLDHCFRPGDDGGLARPRPTRCSLTFTGPDATISVEAAFGPCGEGPPASHIRIGARRYASGVPAAPPATTPPGSSAAEPPPSTTTPGDQQPSAVPPGTVTAPAATVPSTSGVAPGTTGSTTVTASVPDAAPGPSPVVEPEVPASWPPLPETGEPLDPVAVAPVALLDGTVAAAPSMVGCDGSHSSVLRVDGDPAAVVDAYAEQIAGRSHEQLAVHHGEVGPARVTNVVADQAGGDKWYLTVTEVPGGPTWALVETATDT